MLDTLIANKIKTLPENIQKAIQVFDWAQEINSIAKRNQLQIDDLEIFHRETLLVIVGLTLAEDFEKNLITHMSIDAKLAETLVEEANNHIFIPLRKIAFSPQEKNREKEIPDHHEIHALMKEEGIQLIDEKELREHPKNDLQKYVDQLFEEKEIPKKEKEELKIPSKEKINYEEVIEEKDLVGIYHHRTNTNILNNKKEINIKKEQLTEKIFKKPHLSYEEFIDLSPSKAEQIKEQGDFLKHIGASE